jgi:hypothetical protein
MGNLTNRNLPNRNNRRNFIPQSGMEVHYGPPPRYRIDGRAPLSAVDQRALDTGTHASVPFVSRDQRAGMQNLGESKPIDVNSSAVQGMLDKAAGPTLAQTRASTLAKYPDIAKAGTPQNKAFVQYANSINPATGQKYGEAGAHANLDNLMKPLAGKPAARTPADNAATAAPTPSDTAPTDAPPPSEKARADAAPFRVGTVGGDGMSAVRNYDADSLQNGVTSAGKAIGLTDEAANAAGEFAHNTIDRISNLFTPNSSVPAATPNELAAGYAAAHGRMRRRNAATAAASPAKPNAPASQAAPSGSADATPPSAEASAGEDQVASLSSISQGPAAPAGEDQVASLSSNNQESGAPTGEDQVPSLSNNNPESEVPAGEDPVANLAGGFAPNSPESPGERAAEQSWKANMEVAQRTLRGDLKAAGYPDQGITTQTLAGHPEDTVPGYNPDGGPWNGPKLDPVSGTPLGQEESGVANFARGKKLFAPAVASAMAREKAAIQRGVGGAPKTARPEAVLLAGKPAVINSSEKVVPNAAGGVPAVLTRNMQRKAGMFVPGRGGRK